ncbi:BlaI/MecI/CopY family transcriptional regulator [Yinghuangia sp. YIM S09857]|uniref:BlaI/MecI/CopY family transcriptional regulator n=1 Tax=Yinghuangia sp. YIM S09857 TaxID=3436929 RepID=UPI003F537E18
MANHRSGRSGVHGRVARRGPGELEGEVLALLWTAGEPRTATWAQEQLGGGLAYSTVVTIMSRLYEKGLLTRVRVGRSYAYLPLMDEAGIAARRMRQVLEQEPDRAAVLASFVSDLSDEDEQTLRHLLERITSAADRGDDEG